MGFLCWSPLCPQGWRAFTLTVEQQASKLYLFVITQWSWGQGRKDSAVWHCLTGSSFLPKKHHWIKRLEHPRSSSLVPCLWGNVLFRKLKNQYSCLFPFWLRCLEGDTSLPPAVLPMVWLQASPGEEGGDPAHTRCHTPSRWWWWFWRARPALFWGWTGPPWQGGPRRGRQCPPSRRCRTQMCLLSPCRTQRYHQWALLMPTEGSKHLSSANCILNAGLRNRDRPASETWCQASIAWGVQSSFGTRQLEPFKSPSGYLFPKSVIGNSGWCWRRVRPWALSSGLRREVRFREQREGEGKHLLMKTWFGKVMGLEVRSFLEGGLAWLEFGFREGSGNGKEVGCAAFWGWGSSAHLHAERVLNRGWSEVMGGGGSI